jgi:hypothetical protein
MAATRDVLAGTAQAQQNFFSNLKREHATEIAASPAVVSEHFRNFFNR